MENVGPEGVRAHGDEEGRGEGDGGVGGGGGAPRPPPPSQLRHPQTAVAKQHKERHVVTWSQQEDDLLREQVGIHGTENWTSIASQFKDKTGRQCRRRWYTYLNAECKKGGWSPEEDMILCEAQKIFGNRWTEIAKVVSGRTDNAVKNRFTTLCKKRAKQDAMSKENHCPYPTSDSENFLFQKGCITTVPSESSSTLKKIRYQIANLKQSHGVNPESLGGETLSTDHARPPFAVVHNCDNVGALPSHQRGVNCLKAVHSDGKALNNKYQGSFLKRDDPKISALLQQAELLSSLALKVSADSTDQCLENAWKELKDYLVENGERGLANNEETQIDFLLDNFEDLIEDLRSSSTGSCPSVRQMDINDDSQCSSEYRCGSNHNSNDPGKGNLLQAEESSLRCHDNAQSFPEDRAQDEKRADREIELPSSSLASVSAAVFSAFEEQRVNDDILLAIQNAEFNSPLQTVPLFSPFKEGLPSPKFSASERQFLLSILGLPSSSPNPNNPSQQPSCKRALLHSL
uniref:Myb-related protein B n=1 Tax=Anthurium amnicola TaxID=1678845 RepID=A0A1D1YW43_9ARAE